MWQWVRHNFRCEECEAEARPKAKRPSAVPRSFRFNHVVGLDLVDVKNHEGVRQHWLNIICWGTSWQQVKIVAGDGSKTAENVWHTFVDAWLRIFDFPETIIVDPGTEFEGYFTQMAEAYGITVLPTDAQSPWQNSRTESRRSLETLL